MPSQRSSGRASLKPHPLPQQHKNTVPPLKLTKVVVDPINQFDYEHVLTLMSTPISLLIQTLVMKTKPKLTSEILI